MSRREASSATRRLRIRGQGLLLGLDGGNDVAELASTKRERSMAKEDPPTQVLFRKVEGQDERRTSTKVDVEEGGGGERWRVGGRTQNLKERFLPSSGCASLKGAWSGLIDERLSTSDLIVKSLSTSNPCMCPLKSPNRVPL